MRLYHSPDYTLAHHAFDTTRKAGWIAESLQRATIANVELIAPSPLTRDDVLAVHDAAYVRAIETGEPRELAESQGFEWDAGLWNMVLASNGGVVAAARAAIEDGVSASLSSGLHHARRDTGSGFCTFNGLAIAAKAMLAESVERVLVLDFDAHCGGGTDSLVRDDARIMHADVAVSGFDHYSPSPAGLLELVRDGGEYMAAIERALAWADERLGPSTLCIYNAGMDPFERCATGGLAGISHDVLAERERAVFAWARRREVPIAFVLAGGYVSPELSESELVDLHRLTIGEGAMAKPARA